MVCFYLVIISASAQKPSGQYIPDKQNRCQVWVTGEDVSDSLSVSWSGRCKSKMAEGTGTLIWYVKDVEVSRYVGNMQKGVPSGDGQYNYMSGVTATGHFSNGVLHGYGKMLFADTAQKLAGNFVKGKLLNLDKRYINRLERNILPGKDTSEMFVNGDNSNDLSYYALVPPQPIKGVLVLFPGTWDDLEYVLSNNRLLCHFAYDSGIAVLVPSVNQRLTLNTTVVSFIDHVFKHAIAKYKLPKDKFVLGGFSMGGLFSIRYTEMAIENPAKTFITPRAVYSVDGPTDLVHLYEKFERAAERNPAGSEPKYALNELKKYIGGPPERFPTQYAHYSTFSKSDKTGGNAKYLKNIPVRIYSDVDITWWIDNRGADIYDMNALDQSAMINFLRKQGNTRASFINAYKKGYRLEGARHPHSWSIVDPAECIIWLKECLK